MRLTTLLALLASSLPFAAAAPAPAQTLSAVLQYVSPDGSLVLRLAGTDVTTRLAGVTLVTGADMAIETLVPPGSQLKVLIVKKGKVPLVQVWRTSKETLQDTLVKQGLAKRAP